MLFHNGQGSARNVFRRRLTQRALGRPLLQRGEHSGADPSLARARSGFALDAKFWMSLVTQIAKLRRV